MKRDRLLSAVAVIALITVVVTAGCSSKGASDDVTVSRCVTEPTGRAMAAGRIANDSSKDSGYAFRVIFTNASGDKVTEAAATVAKVEADGTATWRARGATKVKGSLTCKVRNVVRTAVS